jgi:hypothetical protein
VVEDSAFFPDVGVLISDNEDIQYKKEKRNDSSELVQGLRNHNQKYRLEACVACERHFVPELGPLL